jgi:Ser/Thr protein kinase RdoA (MazF antagonist)
VNRIRLLVNRHPLIAFLLDHLLAGYRRERPLEATWIEQIPLFLKLQELWVYIAINEFNQMAQHGQLATIPPKHRALLTKYRQNIEQDIPYLSSAYNPWQSA